MTDLVVLSLEAWDAVWRRNQHLVAGLLRRDPGLRVLFVEPAVDVLHELTRLRAPRRAAGLRGGPPLPGVSSGRLWLHEPAKWLPRRVDGRVDERIAASAVRAAGRVGMTEPLLWVNDPDGAAVLEQTGWPALYDVTDDWTLATRPADATARTVRAEQVLLQRAREVVVCSPALAASKGADRAVTLVPNGVDMTAYREPAPRPVDVPAGPYAVYVGTLHPDRLDVDLCVRTAKATQGVGGLLLVGPVLLGGADRGRLEAAGCILAGPRPAPSVPAYLQHAALLVVPHVVTPFTDSLDPIKLYEYRAAGRPVVSTPVAGFRDHPDPLIATASGADFVELVRARLAAPATPLAPPRTDVPTWDDRVTAMSDVLARLQTTP